MRARGAADSRRSGRGPGNAGRPSVRGRSFRPAPARRNDRARVSGPRVGRELGAPTPLPPPPTIVLWRRRGCARRGGLPPSSDTRRRGFRARAQTIRAVREPPPPSCFLSLHRLRPRRRCPNAFRAWARAPPPARARFPTEARWAGPRLRSYAPCEAMDRTVDDGRADARPLVESERSCRLVAQEGARPRVPLENEKKTRARGRAPLPGAVPRRSLSLTSMPFNIPRALPRPLKPTPH